MEAPMKSGEFRVRRIRAKDHGFAYSTFQVVGYLHGQRIRKEFKSREEADGEKNRLEVEAANADSGTSGTRAINTRLTAAEVGQAEAAFVRLAGKSLAQAVECYLSTYRPPTVEKPLTDAVTAFLAGNLRFVPQTATLSGGLNALADKNFINGTTYRQALMAGAQSWNYIRQSDGHLNNNVRKYRLTATTRYRPPTSLSTRFPTWETTAKPGWLHPTA
jgi:hypothetical protein